MAKKKVARVDSGKVIGYIRVSTADQELGAESQRAGLVKWCEQNGKELVEVHEDLGVSGSTPLSKRPGLLGAVAAMEVFGCSVLLAYRRDRYARDTLIRAGLDQMVRVKLGASIRTVQGDFEEVTPENKMMGTIVDAFAEYELAMIRLRTKAAMRIKKERGEVVGEIEFGYREAARDGEGKVRMVEPDPEEQATLAAIRKYVEEGLPPGLMMRKLWQEGRRPRGGRAWSHEQLRRRKRQLGLVEG